MSNNKGRGMRYGGLVLCGWGALALLTAAGCGVVANLGDNPEVGGEGGNGGDGGELVAGGTMNTGGTTANQGGTGAGSNGGAAVTAGTGGSQSPVVNGGGEGGGSGAGGDSPGPLSYPLEPTIPISADCTCADAASVCNAQDECVPRCEPGGVCAVWRVERGLTSTLVNGDDIYFVLAAAHDLFGNAVDGDDGKETLWKARYPDLAPTKVGALPDERSLLIGRVGNTTYVQGGYNGSVSLHALADDGKLTTHELPAKTMRVKVSAAGAFAMLEDDSISKLEVNSDGSFGQGFVPAVPAPTANGSASGLFVESDLFVGDRLWRASSGELCSFDLAALNAPGVCAIAGSKLILGASGSRAVIYGASYSLVEVDVGIGAARVLSDPREPAAWSSTSPGMALANGWVTVRLTDALFVDGKPARDETRTLVRIPVASVAPPTPLISNEVAAAIATGTDFPFLAGPMVTSDAVYFSQALREPKGPGTSRYIFRAPLPK